MFGLHFSRLGSVNILAPINRALSFISALSNSITPQRGSAATFTRSTTATVVDQDSVVRTAKINEARFQGMRRVENLLSYSQDFSNAAWSGFGTVTRTSNTYAAPDGTLTADSITIAASSGLYQGITPALNSTYMASVYIRGDTSQTVEFLLNGTSTGVTSTTVTITPQWQRAIVSKLTNSLDTSMSVQFYSSSTGAPFEVWGAQLENVTGQAVQTVGEYVSTNVLSSPYHGAGVDGVKYFNTTLDGAPLSGKFLSEPARTNLVRYSEQFDNVNWLRNNATVTANTLVCPIGGGVLADTITGLSVATSYVYQGCTLTQGLVYTQSVWAKIGTFTSGNQITIRDFNDYGYAAFDLTNSTLGARIGTCSASYMTQYPDGWWRLEAVFTTTIVTGNHNIGIAFLNSITANTVYVAGHQIEAGNRASSYIPTVASAVTRAADSLSYPVTAYALQGGFSCTLIPTEAPATAAMFYAVGLFGATNADVIGIYTDAGTSDLSCYVRRAGASTLNLILGTVVAGTTYKVAISWAGTAVKASVNGGAVISGTASNMPTSLSSFNNSIDTVWNGQISDVKVFTQTLSDNTLRQLTT